MNFSNGAERVSSFRDLFFWFYRVAIVSLVVVCSEGIAVAELPQPLSAQTLKKPGGPNSPKGLGESFSTALATGTGVYSVPIEVPPALLKPSLALMYSAGRGRSEYGLSFSLPLLEVRRTTDKGNPRFVETDLFAVDGPHGVEELVPVDTSRKLYRAKIESSYTLYERDLSNDCWILHFADGGTAILGGAEGSRENSRGRAFRWRLSELKDVWGHYVKFEYFRDRGKLYPLKISYQLDTQEEYNNSIDFVYEARPDVYVDYSYGTEIATAKRVAEIVVSQGGKAVRTYALSYTAELNVSLLYQIRETGKGGLGLQPLTFEYHRNSASTGSYVEMTVATTTGSSPPFDELITGRATLEDVNADGLPDLLVGTGTDYQYYENLDGRRWSGTPVSLKNSPDRHLNEAGTVLADIDGDGYRDVAYVQTGSGNLYFHRGGGIENGIAKGFRPRAELSVGSTGYGLTDAATRLLDVNSDGRTDLLVSTSGNTDSVIITPATGALKEEIVEKLPSDAPLSLSTVSLFDFNGDTVLDLVRRDFPNERLMVWYGLGGGAYTTMREVRTPQGADAEFFLTDINRDGLTDLLRLSGSYGSYYLNRGGDKLNENAVSLFGLPPSWKNLKVLLADMNGNGTVDVVWLTSEGKIEYLDLMGQPYVGLLSRIDNGLGAVTEITYRSSTEYAIVDKLRNARWKTPLPNPVPVIDEIRTSDSMGLFLGGTSPIGASKMTYHDGYWDGPEREFRGFGRVTQTESGDLYHEGAVNDTWYHVGRNLETGVDEEALKGRAYAETTKDLSGALYKSVESKWSRIWLCQKDLVPQPSLAILPDCSRFSNYSEHKGELVQRVVTTDTLHGVWEKTSTPKFVASHHDYDSWGFERRIENYGEVVFSGGHSFGAVWELSSALLAEGADEVVEETKRAYNVSTWVVGVPYENLTLQYGTNTVVSRNVTLYDGKGLGEVQRGAVSEKLSWLNDGSFDGVGRLVSTSRMLRNADGLVEETIDAENRTTVLTYDPYSRQFPVAETRDTGNRSIQFAATYNQETGAVTSFTDPNRNTTSFEYDGLGRLTAVIEPLNYGPTVKYSYQDSSPISTTTIQQLVSANGSASGEPLYRESRVFTDGFGRERLKKTTAESPHGFIGTGWSVLSSRGSPIRTFVAFASESGEFTVPATSVSAQEFHYDALGRVVRVDNPATAQMGQTSVVTQYRPFETSVFGERDQAEKTVNFPKQTIVDGQGRTRFVLLKNQNAQATQTLQWAIGYDAIGNIRSFVDPKGNERKYQYDSLQRLSNLTDPNLGTVEYSYNDVGQLSVRRDGLGQEQRNSYDAVGRLATVTYANDINGRAPEVHSFHYDEPAPGTAMAGARNLVGQLSWVESPVTRDYFSYDALGRQTDQVVEIWDGKSPFNLQTRQRYATQKSYNSAGEVVSRTLPGGFSAGFQYNQRGLLASATAGFSGDMRSFLSDVEYNVQGAPTSQTHGNGTKACQRYDERNRPVDSIVGRVADISCSDLGASNIGFQHMSWEWTYDGMLANRKDRSKPNGNGSRLDAAYEYDRANQVISVADTYGKHDFEYDEIQNLTKKRTLPPGRPVSERIEEVLSYGPSGPLSVGPNRVLSVGARAFEYDKIGNLKAYNGYLLEFNPAGQLIQATKPGEKILRYFYDAAGERRLLLVEKPAKSPDVYSYPVANYETRNGDEHWKLSAGLATAEVMRAEGLRVDAFLLDELTQYVLSPAGKEKPLPQEFMDLNGDGQSFNALDLALAQQSVWDEEPVGGTRTIWRFLHGDLLGSTATVTDSAGDVVGATRYHVYGETAERRGIEPTDGYTGAEWEPDQELGLIRMGARYYAPALGRWVTPDRYIGESPGRMIGSVIESNLYSYALNNPIVHKDPTGQQVPPEMNLAAIRPITEPYLRDAANGGTLCNQVMTCGPSSAEQSRLNSSNVSNSVLNEGEIKKEQAWKAEVKRLAEYDKPIQSVPLVDMVIGAGVLRVGRLTVDAYEAAVMARLSSRLEQELALYDRALSARDEVVDTFLKFPKRDIEGVATVVGGYNRVTGEVTVGTKWFSGERYCAEDVVVRKLGGNADDIVMTPAIRPWSPQGPKVIDVCPSCQLRYPMSFGPGTTFASPKK